MFVMVVDVDGYSYACM